MHGRSPVAAFSFIVALACALVTNVAFLLKHRGAVLASPVRVRHPLQSAAGLQKQLPANLRESV